MKSGRTVQFSAARAINVWEMWLLYEKVIESESLLQFVVAKTIEELVVAHYGLLRGGADQHPEVEGTRRHLDIVRNNSHYKSSSIPFGIKVRWFALRHRMAGIVVSTTFL